MLRLLKRWKENEPEELLFQLIFRSLGYTVNAGAFEELARLYPYSTLKSFFLQPPRSSPVRVISRWFGSCGTLSEERLTESPTLRHEQLQWTAEWQTLKAPLWLPLYAVRFLTARGCTQRRLLGMYHHFYLVAGEGLFKSRLMLLSEIHLRTGKEELRSLVMKHSQSLFETPDWESCRFELMVTGRPSSLIGRERQVIVWSNAILPFFLAYARLHNDSDLERLLYQIFMILPPEALNSKTRFMETGFGPLQGKNSN